MSVARLRALLVGVGLCAAFAFVAPPVQASGVSMHVQQPARRSNAWYRVVEGFAYNYAQRYSAGQRRGATLAVPGRRAYALTSGRVRFRGMVAGVPVLTIQSQRADGRATVVTYVGVRSSLVAGQVIVVGDALGTVPTQTLHVGQYLARARQHYVPPPVQAGSAAVNSPGRQLAGSIVDALIAGIDGHPPHAAVVPERSTPAGPNLAAIVGAQLSIGGARPPHAPQPPHASQSAKAMLPAAALSSSSAARRPSVVAAANAASVADAVLSSHAVLPVSEAVHAWLPSLLAIMRQRRGVTAQGHVTVADGARTTVRVAPVPNARVRVSLPGAKIAPFVPVTNRSVHAVVGENSGHVAIGQQAAIGAALRQGVSSVERQFGAYAGVGAHAQFGLSPHSAAQAGVFGIMAAALIEPGAREHRSIENQRKLAHGAHPWRSRTAVHDHPAGGTWSRYSNDPRAARRAAVSALALLCVAALVLVGVRRFRRRARAARSEIHDLRAAARTYQAVPELPEIAGLSAKDALVRGFRQDDALALQIDLQRIPLADRETLADLDGDDDATQFVDLPYDSCVLHNNNHALLAGVTRHAKRQLRTGDDRVQPNRFR